MPIIYLFLFIAFCISEHVCIAQNHRTVEAGKNLLSSYGPTPLPEQPAHFISQHCLSIKTYLVTLLIILKAKSYGRKSNQPTSTGTFKELVCFKLQLLFTSIVLYSIPEKKYSWGRGNKRGMENIYLDENGLQS